MATDNRLISDLAYLWPLMGSVITSRAQGGCTPIGQAQRLELTYV